MTVIEQRMTLRIVPDSAASVRLLDDGAVEVRLGTCAECRHWGTEPHSQARDLRECMLINTKAIPSIMELGTVRLESGDYASSDAQLWVDGCHGCVLFEAKT